MYKPIKMLRKMSCRGFLRQRGPEAGVPAEERWPLATIEVPYPRRTQEAGVHGVKQRTAQLVVGIRNRTRLDVGKNLMKTLFLIRLRFDGPKPSVQCRRADAGPAPRILDRCQQVGCEAGHRVSLSYGLRSDRERGLAALASVRVPQQGSKRVLHVAGRQCL